GTKLRGADLSGASLSKAVLSTADLSAANLEGADLSGASLSKADLSFANLSAANLEGADLSGANPEAARSLQNTRMYSVKGITEEQLSACQAKGATIDEAITQPAFRQLVAEDDLRGAVSDAPKTDTKDDRLGFKPYVDVLYGFITAPETTTPLVISIN